MPKMVETLRQEEMWYGEDGFPYRIDEMELSHLCNVLGWLTRRAAKLRQQHYWDEFLEYNDLDDGYYGLDARAAFYEWLRRQNELESDSTVWLRQMPLIQALRREIARRDAHTGDVVGVHYDQELEDDSDGTHGRAVGPDPRLRDRPALG
jgi:hypothetical protein